jgi:hypothetical protein
VVGDDIYFSEFIYPNTNYFSKMKIDGTGYDIILNGNIYSPYVVDDWIYYGDSHGLMKVRIDGTGKTKLSNEFAIYLCVEDNYIYYYNESSQLCKIRTDGTGKKILDAHCSDINVYHGTIYYYYENDAGKENYLCKMKTDGSGQVVLYEDRVESVYVVEDWIYYEAMGQIFRIKNDGTQRQLFE